MLLLGSFCCGSWADFAACASDVLQEILRLIQVGAIEDGASLPMRLHQPCSKQFLEVERQGLHGHPKLLR